MEVAAYRYNISCSGYDCLLDGEISVFSITLICNRIRFYINLSSKNLGEPGSSERSRLAQTFRRLKKKLPATDVIDDDAPPKKSERKLTNWVMKACKPLMIEIATANHIATYETLEQYIHPPTYTLRLINKDGRLCAERCLFDRNTTPETHTISRIPIKDLPECKYAFVSANTVQLFDNGGPFHHIVAEKVKIASGSEYFFKLPCLREIETHQRIETSQKLPADLRITHIQGLVEAYSPKSEPGVEGENNRYIVGMLLNLIDAKHNLNDAEAENTKFSIADRKKWFEQVRYIVLKLHDAGIYWGDVQPGNVVIDQDDDAWVVDMAGGYTIGCGVTEENCETEEGDFRGLEYLALYMGVAES